MTVLEFAKVVEEQQIARLNSDSIVHADNVHNCRTEVLSGRKYTKVNLGGAGKYMIDREGNIFGIKAYGVIHRGHQYGTLDTVHNYFWGGYAPIVKGRK